MHLGSCTILLCLGHVYVPTMLLVDTADDDSQSRDSETWDEFQRSHEAAFTAGQSNYYCGSSSRSNDPDDELVIVGSSKSDEIRYFNPVDEFWQHEKCRQLNLQPEVYFQFNRPVKILNSPLQWIDVVPDGNCFYRALSYWVSGTEDNHLAIRLRVLEIVRTDQRILEFQGEENYREHLIWLSQNSWATEVEIVAATLLLDTPIYVYSQRNRTWDLFDQNKKSKGPLTKTDKCIYIQHILGVHYNLVTDVISDQDLAGDDPDAINSRMWDEYRRTYLHNQAGFAGESTGSKINDPDDRLSMVGSSTSDEVGYFNPVDQFWQYQMCRQLKMDLENYFQFNQVVKILNFPLQWVAVTPDQNCFYRALSFWVSGTEDNHLIVRLRVLEIVRTDQRIMEYLGEENYRAHLIWLSQNSWATEVEIVAATLLLNTPIYVYSQQNRTWDLYDQNKKYKSPLTKTDKCIYIQHISGIHYNLVTDVVSDQDQGKIILYRFTRFSI
ncbi:uncharacterized protein LOC126840811 [Adelges cooleyi]|uniref:uncharacterized protein LOC126840811 n=1 Tax=Adelges cooleyi TaxID=133065 RepID=UPI00217F2C7B|nr:uncharacterized protein LOC126840811 [Adelges cooleyi]